MKLHNHVIIEEPRGGIIWYPRWFFHLYRGPEYGERRLLDGHLEFVLSKPTAEFGVSFEVGTRGSETPFDGHVKIAGTALYWGLKQGGDLADRITQLWFNRQPNRLTAACLTNECNCPQWKPGATMKRHHGRNGQEYDDRYDGRQIKIYTFEQRLWWMLWTRKNASRKGQFAEWRSGSARLNPLDVLFGDHRYWYDDVDTAELQIQMPEGTYPVKVTLQQQRFGRPKLPGRHLKSWTVDVDAAECKGIPYRFDHSGGWKGDRVWGFSVKLTARRRDWQVDAKAAIEAYILKSRAESGFREPLPLDAD